MLLRCWVRAFEIPSEQEDQSLAVRSRGKISCLRIWIADGPPEVDHEAYLTASEIAKKQLPEGVTSFERPCHNLLDHRLRRPFVL